ncbi:SPOR domain-containing protein [Paenibacillus sp. sgz302251]|uniref:SPOR domain-containing protein n=1 Tax=Paenibacillus sp. sgz302251 TaxID=3414493 RepID=UPI003C7ACE46
MNQKNRITYRFDRAGNSISEEKYNSIKQQEAPSDQASSQTTAPGSSSKAAKMNVIPLYHSIEQHHLSEINPWNSPFQEDIGALEQLIRDTDLDKNSDSNFNSTPTPTPTPNSSIKEQSYTAKQRLHSVKTTPIVDRSAHSAESEPILDMLSDELEAAEGDEINERYEHEMMFDHSRMNTIHSARARRSAGGPSWFNVFLSVSGALATGALFGYLLLSLFTGASLWPGSAKEQSAPVIGSMPNDAEPAASVSGETFPTAGTETSSSNDPNTKTVALSGLDQSYYMLQFGVFSNSEGRDAALDQLAKKGFAAAGMTGDNDYRVYAGIASDRDKAKTIQALLPDLQLYIKEVNISTPAAFPYEGDAAEAQAFFEQTSELIRMFEELTLAQLEQPSLSSLGESAAEAWQAQHRMWTENAEALRIGISDEEGKMYLEKLNQSLQTAAKALQYYDKEPSRTLLWSTQSEVMNAVIVQKEWFKSISAL